MGPGSAKVTAGEYELFNTFDRSQIISQSDFEDLTPGASITMAIIIGQCGKGPVERCPKPGCQSSKLVPDEAGGQKWYVYFSLTVFFHILMRLSSYICKTWLDQACKTLPRPFRPLDTDSRAWNYSSVHVQGKKRKKEEITNLQELKAQLSGTYKRMRTERRTYKNLRVYFTKLTETPVVSNVRDVQRFANPKKRSGRLSTSCENSMVSKPLNFSNPATSLIHTPSPPRKYGLRGQSLNQDQESKIPSLKPWVMATQDVYGPRDSTCAKEVATPIKPSIPATTRSGGFMTTDTLDSSRKLPRYTDHLMLNTLSAVPDYIEPWPSMDEDNALEHRSISAISKAANRSSSKTVVSEPYWLAMSESASVWTDETAPPDFPTQDPDHEVRRGFISELCSETGNLSVKKAASIVVKRDDYLEKTRNAVKSTKDLSLEEQRRLACLRCKFLKKNVSSD